MPVLIASRPSAKINGQPNVLIDNLLIGLEVNEQVDGLSVLRLRLKNWVQGANAPAYAFDDASILKFGDELALGFNGSGFQEVFRGPVLSVEAEYNQGQPPTIIFVAEHRQRVVLPGRRLPIQTPPTINLSYGAGLLSARGFGSQTHAVDAIEGTAEGNPLLRRGTHVTLSGLGNRFSGNYQVTQCSHRFDISRGYQTDFVASPVG